MNSNMNRGRQQQRQRQQQGSGTSSQQQQPSLTAASIAAAQPPPDATMNACAAHNAHADLDETEENSSNEEGGNNSDNSALVSIGNTSFGFNFDSDERMSRQENTSDNDGDISGDGGSGSGSGGDSSPNEQSQEQQQQQQQGTVSAPVSLHAPQSRAANHTGSSSAASASSLLTDGEVGAVTSATEGPKQGSSSSSSHRRNSFTTSSRSSSSSNDAKRVGFITAPTTPTTYTTSSNSNIPAAATAAPSKASNTTTTSTSAAAAVPPTKAGLDQAAADAAAKAAAHTEASNRAIANLKSLVESCVARQPAALRKRKGDHNNETNSGDGYNSDDEGNRSSSQRSTTSSFGNGGGGGGGKRHKKQVAAVVDEQKREERNAREKERSFRISKQIDDLRNALSSGGVIVPKGTKSSVLTEAANYIRMLQQHQYRSEIDRHQLIQQMQMIGAGAHGPQAAQTIRQVAAQQGVWSLGNFGGVPPKSAIIPLCPQSSGGELQADSHHSSSSSSSACGANDNADAMHPTKIDSSEYRSVFNSCGVGMAIASMGGAFIDCNQLFCHISNYNKQEVCALTIFNLTERQDLQHAFDLICKIISPPMTAAMIAAADDTAGAADADLQDADNSIKNIVLRGAMKERSGIGLCVSLVKQDGVAKCFCVTLIKNPSSPFDTSKPVPLSFEMAATMMSATSSAAAMTLISKDQPDGNPGATRPTFTSG